MNWSETERTKWENGKKKRVAKRYIIKHGDYEKTRNFDIKTVEFEWDEQGRKVYYARTDYYLDDIIEGRRIWIPQILESKTWEYEGRKLTYTRIVNEEIVEKWSHIEG